MANSARPCAIHRPSVCGAAATSGGAAATKTDALKTGVQWCAIALPRRRRDAPDGGDGGDGGDAGDATRRCKKAPVTANCLEQFGPAGRPVWPIQSAVMARRRGRGIIQYRVCGEIGARSGLCSLDWIDAIGMCAKEV